jgi:serine/threonine-protein kinase
VHKRSAVKLAAGWNSWRLWYGLTVLQVPGGTIGSYRVVRKLGEGGMGTVYLGEHTLLGRAAAIKVLLPSLLASEEIVQRFFNEARAVTRIADPGIVQVFDFGHQVDVGAYIIMELLEGESIGQRLRRIGRFEPLEALRLMRLVAGSLAAAHGKGIVHRDLKPENIFIVPDPGVPGGERAKILDFGIAKLAGDEAATPRTRTGAVMGTPMYMSPEQCSGGGVIDHRSDIYAIGCVTFAMLTGRAPFDGPGSGDLIAAHLREPAPLASTRVRGLSGAIDALVQRCMQKSPAQRFSSMTEFGHALAAAEHALAGQRAAPPGAPSPDPLPWPAGAELTTTFGPAAPTPPSPWTGENLSNPTTLHDASGQANSSPRSTGVQRRSRRWLAGAASVLLGVIGAAVAISRQEGGAERAGVLLSGSGRPADLVVVQRDAAPSPPSSPPLPALDSGVDMATGAPVDAGVTDAATPAPAIDAGVVPGKPRAPNRLHTPTTGGVHEGSAGSAVPHFGRGD